MDAIYVDIIGCKAKFSKNKRRIYALCYMIEQKKIFKPNDGNEIILYPYKGISLAQQLFDFPGYSFSHKS